MLLAILLATALMAGAPNSWAKPVPKNMIVASQDKGGKKQVEKANGQTPPSKTVVTLHKIAVGGKEIRYTATVGQLPIKNDKGETEAHIYFIAYAVSNPPAKRPLLFIFNGGPGAASVWLHMGAIGPRRVKMLADGSMPPPPYRLVDNKFTWLDMADLVFIDPVGTGYSRAVKPELTRKFTSVRGDITSVRKFIRLYLTRYKRWSSPLFLVGESYGTFRAAGLSEDLVEHGIALNGILMLSSIMNLETTSFDNGNDLPYALFLPSYTATAWYHKKLAPHTDLDKVLHASEEWAATDYLTALEKGDRLSPKEREAVVDKLAEFTGLDKAFIDNRNLRIDRISFATELLRKQRQVIGLLDSRFTAANLNPDASLSFDPAIAVIRPPFTSTFDDYVRRELGFKSDLEYFTLGGGIGQWDWDAKNSYADTSDNLRNTFAKNPYMKLFVASGYFDLATPYFGQEYTLAHLGLTRALRGNITMRLYRAGHMMYLDEACLIQLKHDVARFINSAMPEH